MFERFTERARQVVVLAQDESRALGHDYIGTEHILLGLLREEDGLAARVLESMKVEYDPARAVVVRVVGRGTGAATTGQIPFTPRAKAVLELSLREALALGHNSIGTEHILLGLVRKGDGVAAEVLDEFDASADEIRGEIVHMLSGAQRDQRAGGFTAPHAEALPRGRRSRAKVYTWDSVRVRVLVIGWLLFGTAAGLGLLLGWLIWGWRA